MIENNYDKFDFFSLGCLFATLFFLSLISGAGIIIQKVFTKELIKVVNVIIGVVILIFGIKLLSSKVENTHSRQEKV
jgi:arginine exporter protein ArgO